MNLPNKPKVLAATYNPVSNTKMISFLVDFPTVLLAELRTHRILTQGSLYEHSELVDFNMSANSARAIPVEKYITKIENNPHQWIWTSKKAGMSGGEVSKEQIQVFNKIQKEKLQFNIDKTKELIDAGCHKQQANRGLSEFAYTTCIISGTEWSNFFELRCPKYKMTDSGKIYNSKKEAIANEPGGINTDTNTNWSYLSMWTEEEWTDGDMCSNISSAQPEFQLIAEILYDLYQGADWQESEYHIPFQEDIEELYYEEICEKCDIIPYKLYAKNRDLYNEMLMKISASMCAKLSYDTQDNPDTLEKHLERANMLIEHKHWEPFSHQAVAMTESDYAIFYRSMLKAVYNPPFGTEKTAVKEHGWCYNLRGFISNRYIIENL